jgi:hypothetical protein
MIRGRGWRGAMAAGCVLACWAAGVAGPTVSAGTASGRGAPVVTMTTGRDRPARRTSGGRDGPVPKLIWGPVLLPNGASAFPIYHRLGVNVFQIDLSWSAVAPTRPADAQNPKDPAYQWPAEVDTAIRQARAYDIKVCLLVQTTPAWANGDKASNWAPDNPNDYANFLIAAARRYPSVRLWMIWGEPNRDGNFLPMPVNSRVGPRRYALLLNAAYRGLKHDSRANIVIGGDTWSFGTVEPADFVRWMRLPDGKPPPLDYYGHNPFSIRFPNLSEKPYFPGGRDINDIDTLETQLQSIYHRQVPLWLSEFTISSNHPNRAFTFAVSRSAQAKWLTAAFRLANSVDYVAGMGWFNLLDESPAIPDGLTTGLMTSALAPKPAFYAFQHAP